MNKSLLLKTLRNTFFAAAYIFLVSLVMQNGDQWFGNSNMLAPFVILLLFCFSAATVGCLVFGQSIFLFFDNKKTESAKAAIYSIGWFGVYTVIGLLLLIIT
ncbi:MAG: hypothetical protein WCP14_00200 [bacterium]